MKAFFASALTLVIAFTAFAGLKAESYNNNYYHELINKVYYEIVLSVGNYSLITPKLVIKDSKKFVAKYSSKKNTIYFEMAAYELCRELGADSLNALAFILAHELAHHYREHGWLKRTGSSYAGLDIGKKLKAAGVSKDKILIYETEADIFAGFYAHVAGYNALPTAKLILDKIYEAYEIPHEIDHYPSLSERKNIAQRSEENLAQLIPVFDAAHNALLIGHYDEAISCLEYILSKKFNSREIYNNIGVAYAMQALEYFSTDELLYVYPFEFDVDSRLNSNARGKEDELTDGEKQERDRLLNLARKYFIISITLDWGYAMAYNNLASIEDLSGQMRDALFYNYKAESLSMDAPEMLAKVYLVHGVILANNGKNKDSRKFFNKAKELGSSLAAINLLKLDDEYQPTKLAASQAVNIVETIDGVDLEKYMILRLDKPFTKIALNMIRMYVKEYEHATLIKFQQSNTFLVETKPNYTGQSKKGIILQDDIQKMLESYGKPDEIRVSGNTYSYIYKHDHIIFKSNNNKITSWLVFYKF